MRKYAVEMTIWKSSQKEIPYVGMKWTIYVILQRHSARSDEMHVSRRTFLFGIKRVYPDWSRAMAHHLEKHLRKYCRQYAYLE